MPTTHRTPGETFAGYTQLVVEVCCSCHVMFAMPAELQERAQKDPDIWFFCCNGHTQHYSGSTEEQRLKRIQDQLEAERRRSGRLAAERDQIEAQRRGQKAANTKLKKRIANGVCPCCRRSFGNLAEHMEKQHPDYPSEGSDV